MHIMVAGREGREGTWVGGRGRAMQKSERASIRVFDQRLSIPSVSSLWWPYLVWLVSCRETLETVDQCAGVPRY